MFSCLCRAFGRGFGALSFLATWPRKHRPCRALATWTPDKNCTCRALATRALEGAARAPAQCPEGALRGCASVLVPQAASRYPPVRSERHFDHLLGAAEGRSSYLLCHLTLDEAFGNAARRICPRLHLRSVTLRSAALCSVHVYARVHTGIYIYIYIIYV